MALAPSTTPGTAPAGGAGPRLPARRPRRRAGVPGAVRRCGPRPTIYTAVYDEQGTEGRFSDRTVHSSFLQRLRPSARTFRALLPLYPAAIESFDLSRLRPGRLELVGLGARGPVRRALGPRQLLPQPVPLRLERPRPDARAGRATRSPARSCAARSGAGASGTGSRRSGPTATSPTRGPRRRGSGPTSAASRRSSIPPVDTARFSPGPVGDHYAIVSELMAHKQIDVAIGAFNQLRLPLIVVGDGPDARRLRRQSPARRSTSPAGCPTAPSPRSSRARGR